MPELTASSRTDALRRVFVWDLPVRLFHWALVGLLITLYVTAEVMEYALETHALAGYALLTLVLFRLAWGFVGGTYARFRDFLHGPKAAFRYGRRLLRGEPGFVAGHNPLGGWMVMALVVTLLAQAVLGLFSNDDILFDGPLRDWVSKETSDMLTGLHAGLFKVILALVILHIAAVLFHRFRRGENLVPAMFTGYKALPADAQAEDGKRGSPLLAVVVLAVCAGLVYLVAV